MPIRQRSAALAAHYKERFEQFVRNGEIENPEQYTQIYAEGVDGRQEFHEWEFITPDGTLLSIHDSKNHPTIRRRSDKGRGPGHREYYNWDDATTSIATYTITALVYGATITPRAKQVLHERGLDAFTTKSSDPEVNLNRLQTHHTHGFVGNRDQDNHESGLLICTIHFHDAITYFSPERFKKALELEGYDPENSTFTALVHGDDYRPQSGTPIIHNKAVVVWADNSYAKKELEDPNTMQLIRNLYNYRFAEAAPGENTIYHIDFGAPVVKGTIYFLVSKPAVEGTDINSDSTETISNI